MDELSRMRVTVENYLRDERPDGHRESMLTYLLEAMEDRDDLVFLSAVAVKPGTSWDDEEHPDFIRRNIDSDNVVECLQQLEIRLTDEGRMCVMTNDYVYFPQEYDSSVWIAAVPRHLADIVPLSNSGLGSV